MSFSYQRGQAQWVCLCFQIVLEQYRFAVLAILMERGWKEEGSRKYTVLLRTLFHKPRDE